MLRFPTKKLGWLLVFSIGLQLHLRPMGDIQAQAMEGMNAASPIMAAGMQTFSCPTPTSESAPNCCLHCAAASPVAVFLAQTGGDANVEAVTIAVIPTSHYIEGYHTGLAPPPWQHRHDVTAFAHLRSVVIIS